MRKNIRLALMLLLAAAFLAGCGAKAPVRFTADNEIMTYTKVDPKKAQITVSSLGNNANVRGLAKAFERANPDV